MLRKLAVGSMLLSALSFAMLGLGTACTSAYADRIAPPGQQQVAVAEPLASSPYTIEIMGEDGAAVGTFENQGKFYVLGNSGERYTIRVANPTGRRVEAVVSVDGLDAIDGEGADLGKRGYIVPPYGELRIEGFRTSTSHVATFRFSSVGNSYAGKKGVARNVGVIGVAIFDEVPPPEIIAPEPIVIIGATGGRDERRPGNGADDYDGRYGEPVPGTRDVEYSAESESGGFRGQAEATAVPSKRSASGPRPSYDGDGASAGAPATPTGDKGYYRPAPPADEPAAPPPDGWYQPAPMPPRPCTECQVKESRPGLGTEFGEQRYSAVSFTKFVRSSPTPVALAELRYNDAAGLMALGIPVQVGPDAGELATRETADPFPGAFAQPPR